MNRVKYDADTGKVYWGDKEVLVGTIDSTGDIKPVRGIPVCGIKYDEECLRFYDGTKWTDVPASEMKTCRNYGKEIDELSDRTTKTCGLLVKTVVKLVDRLKEDEDTLHKTFETTGSLIAEDRNRIDELTRQVESLNKAKMDKPSMSIELASAERFIDDYAKLRTTFAQEKFARKQRIRRKLERLKKANAHKLGYCDCRRCHHEKSKKVMKKVWAVMTVIASAIILGIILI